MKKMIDALLSLLVLVFIVSNDADAQIYQWPVAKQLTNFDYDSHSPGFFRFPSNHLFDCSEIFYVAQHGTSADICLLKYNPQLDTFYQSTPLVRDGFMNTHPIGKRFTSGSTRMLVWETNKNGNKDLAYMTFDGTAWGAPKILLGSIDDETNPSFIYDKFLYTKHLFDLLYYKGNSIYRLYGDTLNTTTLPIFEGTYPGDSISYTDGTAAWEYFSPQRFLFVALKRVKGQEPILVYRYLHSDSTLSSEFPVYTGAGIAEPKFVHTPDAYRSTLLSFIALSEGQRKILFLWGSEGFGNNSAAFAYETELQGDFSGFSYTGMYLVGLKQNGNIRFYHPHSFILRRNDTTFAAQTIYNFVYHLKPLKMRNSRTETGLPAFYINHPRGLLSYIIWEDSSNGRMNLFGCPRYDQFGDVNESSTNSSYELIDCYPNPFNPVTTITYALPVDGIAVLKVYDILGNEIRTVVNEEKTAGRYTVSFNASSLPSGTYFYELRAGDFRSVKKMILVK